MKFKILSICFIFVCAFAFNCYGGQKSSKSAKKLEIVAEVNGEKITRKQFGEFLIQAYGDVALDYMVKKAVVSQEAKKNEVKVTEKELDERLNQNAEARIMIMMRKKGYRTKEDLELELFKSGMTLDKLKKNIIASVKNQAEIELIVEKILLRDITFTEDELYEAYDNNFGEKVAAKQIVLKTRKKADEVLRKLNGGAEFEALARKDSIDRASAARGGEMMPFNVNSTLGKSVAQLKEGQISDVIETGYGYHIIKVIKKLPGNPKKFEEVLDTLEKIVQMEKLNQKVQPWLYSLFQSAKVEVSL